MEPEDEAFEELAKRQGDWGLQGSRKHQIMRYVENVESKGASMTDKEALAMALEALECANSPNGDYENEIAALKERLAQDKALQALHNENERLGLYKDVYTEPVAQYSDIVSDGGLDPRNKFDVQPQRTWVGLTDEEILSDDTLRYYYGMNGGAGPVSQKGKKVIAAIEAKLKQKNGYAEEKNT